MRRIAIVGNSGTGKSTLARQLAVKLDLTHIELDSLFHHANWPSTPVDEFQAKIRSALATADATTDGWTTCGNYRSASGRVNQQAADTIVWLDMPRWLIMRRTLRRALTREVLGNGNREPLTNFYRWDPNKNILPLGMGEVRQLSGAELGGHDRREMGPCHGASTPLPAEVKVFLAAATSD
jgi:hypothetical protein